MPYETDEKLKSYLDTNQLHREQMCRAILSIDKRFTDVHPRHPRGGPDGGRDIEASYKENQIAYGAVGFINQANDSNEQKKQINKKFHDDLRNAVTAKIKPDVFIFFTNICLTIGEKSLLIKKAKKSKILFCDIFDRERLRIALDSPDGFSIRFQYLGLPLSEAEQASFFARWGDDIQSVVSSGFRHVEKMLNRVLFFQESMSTMMHLTILFELNRKYTSEEIDHFRLFCLLLLKEPKNEVMSMLFGSSDKSNRMKKNIEIDLNKKPSGIKHGISSGQWVEYVKYNNAVKWRVYENPSGNFKRICVSQRRGVDEVNIIPIRYQNDNLIRLSPRMSLRDIDDAMFVFYASKSLSVKIKTIHVFSNGYMLQEISKSEFYIDDKIIKPPVPASFSEKELADSWVKIVPKGASFFRINFFEKTPKRMYSPAQLKSSYKNRNS